MRKTIGLAIALAMIATSSVALAHNQDLGDWGPAEIVEGYNTPDALEGCPFISRDGKKMFMASTRSGGLGGIDIWVTTRESVSDGWGQPVNVGAPVNTGANDFCPTLAQDGRTLFFVSNRPGHCAGPTNADLYTAVTNDQDFSGPAPFFGEVTRLACHEDGGPNSAGNEFSPSPLTEPRAGRVLYYSSTRSGVEDIYSAQWVEGAWGQGSLVPGLNTAVAEGQPNVRHDGLEIFFYRFNGAAGNDIFSASRASTADEWSNVAALGSDVNSNASETRPSLSSDGHTLYFGSTRTGAGDHYMTSR